MPISRRQYLRLAAGFAGVPVFARKASAQVYPARPVRIIVGFAPGGASDITARLMAQWLTDQLGQQFIVENRPGAGTNIGTEAVINSAPDGYTLLLVSVANTVNATLYEKLNFNFIHDIAPIASIWRVANVLVVTQSFPARTVPEFIAYAKANPGKINFASPGIGTATHMSGELFKMMAGVNIIHVPYRGNALALSDLISGRVQAIFDNITSSIEYIKAGELRALAVTTAARSELLPDIPTLADFLPGYEGSGWVGISAPKGTPAVIIDKLNREINAGLGDPKIKARLADMGGAVLPGSPADFGRLIVDETEMWGKVIRAANIKVK